MNNPENIGKARMEAAFDDVNNITSKKTIKEFESYVNKVPAFIHTNGVGNTFAYLAGQAKEKTKKDGKIEKNTWAMVADTICNWLNNKHLGFNEVIKNIDNNGTKAKKLLFFVKELDDKQTRALTVELLAYLNWLRKFAKAKKIELE